MCFDVTKIPSILFFHTKNKLSPPKNSFIRVRIIKIFELSYRSAQLNDYRSLAENITAYYSALLGQPTRQCMFWGFGIYNITGILLSDWYICDFNTIELNMWVLAHIYVPVSASRHCIQVCKVRFPEKGGPVLCGRQLAVLDVHINCNFQKNSGEKRDELSII